MTETVSREELDALLSAYRAANAGQRKPWTSRKQSAVMPYKVRQSGVVSAECLKILKRFHQDYATAVSELLSNIIRVPVSVSAAGIDQMTRREYRESMTGPVMLMEIEAHPLADEILLAIDPSLVGYWTDVICGGSAEAPCEPSQLTRIDLAMAARVAENCLQKYAELWPGKQGLRLETSRICTSDEYVSGAAPSEAVLSCTLEVVSDHCSGRMILCLPAASVETNLSGSGAPKSKVEQNINFTELLREALGEVELECRVVLGRTQLPFSKTLGLDVGDVIRTNVRSDANAEICVGDISLFPCRPRVVGRRLAAVVCDESTEPVDKAVPLEEAPNQPRLKVA
ncbi:MAG: flagellar motor switch protein FliM [Armatimonadota bacterium]